MLTLAITCSSEQLVQLPAQSTLFLYLWATLRVKHCFTALSLVFSVLIVLFQIKITLLGFFFSFLVFCGGFLCVFVFCYFFNPLIKSSGRNFSKTKREQTEWLHYEMRTDLTLPNFQYSGALPLLWRKLRGLQWYVQPNRNSLGWFCFNHIRD